MSNSTVSPMDMAKFMSAQHLSAPFAALALNDVNTLRRKDAEYGSSWKKRGGVGAFMMLARKMDRIEKLLDGHAVQDLVQALQDDTREEGVKDDVGDLRRYLLLVYCQIWSQIVYGTGDHEHFMGPTLLQTAERCALYAESTPKIECRRGEETVALRDYWRRLEALAKDAGWDVFQVDLNDIIMVAGRLYAIEVAAYPT